MGDIKHGLSDCRVNMVRASRHRLTVKGCSLLLPVALACRFTLKFALGLGIVGKSLAWDACDTRFGFGMFE